MTPERWVAAQQLFEAALACPGDARAAFVDREAADPALAELVHGLLAADAEEHAGTPLAVGRERGRGRGYGPPARAARAPGALQAR